MSIYIKGMEMPETCYECPCGDNEFYWCMATKGRNNYHRDEFGYPDGERQDWCPLIPVPDHGRLIEAEAAKELLKPVDAIRNYEPEWTWGELYESNCVAIDKLPTIIPGEEAQE